MTVKAEGGVGQRVCLAMSSETSKKRVVGVSLARLSWAHHFLENHCAPWILIAKIWQ